MGAVARLSRGFAASSVLFALLGGVPWFLSIAIGWPLPRAVPAWNDITATLAGDLPLDADTVWKVLACVIWVAWVQILAAAVVEVAALARGGVANPIRGLAHMQGITGPLLSAAALLLPGSLSHPGTTAGPPASTARTLVARIEVPATPPPAPPSPDPAPTASTPSATIEHTVVHRDTLWDLAERYLAPGGTNEEVAAAVQRLYELNAGVPQPDGATLTDASRIRRGWVLHIPATGAPAPAAFGDSGATGATVTVQPGDSLWELAEDNLDDGLRYPELFDLNAGRPQPDGHALTDPSLIRPSWNIELPAAHPPPTVPAPAPPAPSDPTVPTTAETAPPTAGGPAPQTQLDSPNADVQSTATTAAPAPPETAAAERPTAPTADDGGDDDDGSPIGALGAAGGLLGSGLAVALATRRRRRRVQRLPGAELPPLPAEAEPILDAIDDVDFDVSAGVDRAVRGLASALADWNPIPVPIIGTIDGANLELLLDREDPNPPGGWTQAADGRIWSAALDVSADEPPPGPAWLPTLVSIGALETGGLLLNLEAVGAVGLVGDPDATVGLASSIAIELGVTALADLPAVHVIGNALGGDVAELPGIDHHPDLSSALAAAAEETGAIAAALVDTGAPNVFDLRCRAPEEAWQPAVIVLSAADTDADAMRELVEPSGRRDGLVAVVVGACPAGALEITVTADHLRIPALGLHCAPQQVDPATVAAMAALLDAADAPCAPPAEPGPLTLFEPAELDGADGAANSEPKIRLRLLGPITAEGVDLRPQQLALLAFLALHPDVTADAMRDALWGGREPTRERFLNTVHGLRRAVGAEVLPASTDNRYRLHGVWCDLAEVERCTTSAGVDPASAATELEAALQLVSGPPLTYGNRHRRHFRWVDLGNHASRWERIVGDAAHNLVTLALANEDAELARWAAERGLVASPANETLTCDLVAAHLAAGDRHAAELVVEEYARVLEDIGSDEPPEALHQLLEPRRAS